MPFFIQWIDKVSGAEDVINLDTPAGKLILSRVQEVIVSADWLQNDDIAPSSNCQLQQHLVQYWSNPNIAVTVKLLRQGSIYRHQVWTELCKIPIGQTITYSILAKKINSAARAVGNACRDNPYPLFIPCHRVVSSAGMGGYCGQTDGDFMTIKHKLLAFESAFNK